MPLALIHTAIKPFAHTELEVKHAVSFECVTDLPAALRKHADDIRAQADRIEAEGASKTFQPAWERINRLRKPSQRPCTLRLTAEDLQAIKLALAEGQTQNDIGRKFNITQAHVSRIKRGEFDHRLTTSTKKRTHREPLLDEQVRQIRKDIATGEPLVSIGKRLGISHAILSQLKRKVTYTSVV